MFFFFLVACMRLYTSLCWLVHPLVCRKSLHFSMHLELKVDQIWVTAPAQLPYWPCILSGSQESFHRLKGERNPSDFIDIHLFFSCVHATHYVGRSVGLSVRPKSLCIFRRLELKGDQIWVTAPAHPHATDAAVYQPCFLQAHPFFSWASACLNFFHFQPQMCLVLCSVINIWKKIYNNCVEIV